MEGNEKISLSWYYVRYCCIYFKYGLNFNIHLSIRCIYDHKLIIHITNIEHIYALTIRKYRQCITSFPILTRLRLKVGSERQPAQTKPISVKESTSPAAKKQLPTSSMPVHNGPLLFFKVWKSNRLI